MRLTDREHEHLLSIVATYEGEVLRQMEAYIHHGAVSTYDHCENVVRVSYWLNARFSLRADVEALVAGALLHDFYLYDWHEPDPSHRLHGFFHAERSKRNAVEAFQIDEKIQGIIQSHMWPLNITRVPKSREAAIVCVADKVCCVIESLFHRKKRGVICPISSS